MVVQEPFYLLPRNTYFYFPQYVLEFKHNAASSRPFFTHACSAQRMNVIFLSYIARKKEREENTGETKRRSRGCVYGKRERGRKLGRCASARKGEAIFSSEMIKEGTRCLDEMYFSLSLSLSFVLCTHKPPCKRAFPCEFGAWKRVGLWA